MNKPEHNKFNLKEKRKELRKNATCAEATLWKFLQQKKLGGRKFRRQHSINNYIVDFYCAKEKLVIELDGAYHLDFAIQIKDELRNQKLSSLGFKVLRFENKLVFEDIDMVLKEITSSFK